MFEITEKIRNHLKIRYKLNFAEEEVIRSGKNEEEVATTYGLERDTLRRKIFVLKDKMNYYVLKEKFHKVIDEILNRELTACDAAQRMELDENAIMNEVLKFYVLRSKGKKKFYDYDRLTCSGFLTFMEEMWLFMELIYWMKSFPTKCFCQFCSLKYVLQITYLYAYDKNREFPCDVHSQEKWLIDFEMRYSSWLERLCPFLCNEKFPRASMSKSQSSSFDQGGHSTLYIMKYLD